MVVGPVATQVVATEVAVNCFPIAPVILALVTDALSPVGWIVAAGIVLVGLLAMGLNDVLGFSTKRIWAISGVCFRESIRKRVLWVTPLTIIGVIVVCQLQKASDEQDAIRQTTKVCLFATGLLVTLTSLILACTSLPKEIENRVIYTIVTKPTTRLEVVIGKIVGFARVNALILLIMGLFTYGYLCLRTWKEEGEVAARLKMPLTPTEQHTLEHYQQSGLLTAKAYQLPRQLEFFARPPAPNDATRVMFGGGEQDFVVPFAVDKTRLFSDGSGQTGADLGAGKTGLLIGIRLKWDQYGPPDPPRVKHDASGAQTQPAQTPGVMVDILGPTQFSLIGAEQITDPQNPKEKSANGNFLELPATNSVKFPGAVKDARAIFAYVPPAFAGQLFDLPRFFVHVTGVSNNVEYTVDPSSVYVVPSPPFAPSLFAFPVNPGHEPDRQYWEMPMPAPDGKPAVPFFRGRFASTGGEQLRGTNPLKDPHQPVAVLSFRGVDVPAGADAKVPLEMRVGIEREGSDLDPNSEADTDVTLAFSDPASGKTSAPIDMKIESRRTAFATIPVADLSGGNFDMLIRCNTPGHILGLAPPSMALVTDQQPFWWNLTKSLFIMWLMTVLVVTLAIFCSTFLSWPIAIILTCVLLLGHWGVAQVADMSGADLGRQLVTQFFPGDARQAQVVVTSVSALTTGLQTLGSVLPDINHFASIEDIEQGSIVSHFKVLDALAVLLGFGLPATVLAYIFLKWKEVAP